MRRPGVAISLSTVPWRHHVVLDMVKSLLPQFTPHDLLYVHFDKYEDEARAELLGQLEALCSGGPRLASAYGDRGDKGKFMFVARAAADSPRSEFVHLICDDDLQYPSNYVETMVQRIEQYPGAIVGVHGWSFNENPKGWGDRDRDNARPCLGKGHTTDDYVNVLGTGTMAVHSSLLHMQGFSMDVFEGIPNAADLHMAVWGQRYKIPFVSIARPRGWLGLLVDVRDRSIYTDHWKKGNRKEIEAHRVAHWLLARTQPWKIYRND